MLTSFFQKSAPVNHLIVGTLLFLGYVMGILPIRAEDLEWQTIIIHLGLIMALVFSMLLLDFIIRKNNLSKKNTYDILIFAGFSLMILQVFKRADIMFAVLFCLFSFRRVFSFTSEKNIEKKILDASLWIGLASFFYAYSLLFLFPIYIAILKRPKTKFRLFFIPPLALLAIFLLATVYYLFTENSFDWLLNFFPPISIDFTAYSAFSLLIPSAIMVSLFLWIGFYRLFRVTALMRKERPNYINLLVVLATSFVVAAASPVKDGSELYFTIPWLAIATTDYLENRESWVITETILWIIMLLPVILYFL